MKAKNRITLLLSVVMVIALLVVGLTVVTSANEGDLQTKYGVVPAESADANFAIFHKALGATEYEFLTVVDDAFSNTAFNNYKDLKGELVALALKSVDLSSSAGLNDPAFLNADLVYDLGGNTIVSPITGSMGLIMARASQISESKDISITIKNGTIQHSKDNVILLGSTSASSSVLGGNNLNIDIIFQNVKFDQVDGMTTDWMIIQVANTHADDKNYFTNSVLFDECVFDTTGIASGTHILFYGPRPNYHSYEIEVKGGEIILNDASVEIARYGAVQFTQGENGYTKFRSPSSVELNLAGNSFMSYESDTVRFVKCNADGNYNYYQPIDLQTEYGLIPNSAASVYDYPFIIFTKAPDGEWTYFGAYADPWVDGVLASYRQLIGYEMVFYMRRDVSFIDRGFCSNLLTVCLDVTVDLNGHNLRSSDAGTDGMLYFATKDLTSFGNSDERSWTFKNGSITTGALPFIEFGHNKDITQTPTVNINFDNVTLNRAEEATANNPFVKMDLIKTCKITANVNYNDCVFDLSGDLAATTTLFSFADADNPNLTANVTVNGGQIIVDDLQNFALASLSEGCPGSFKLGKDADGNMTQLIIPASDNDEILGFDGLAYFSKASTVDGNDFYVVITHIDTAYGKLPVEYHNENFAIFHKAPGASEYTFWGAAANPFTYKKDSATYESLDGEVVILMMKDSSSANFGNKTIDLTSAIRSALTIDFDSHTFTGAPCGGTGAFRIKTANINEDTITNITFKKGTFTTRASQALLVGHNDEAITNAATFNLTFDRMTFNKTDFYAQAFVQVNKSEVKSTVNIVYNDCTLDLRGITIPDGNDIYPFSGNNSKSAQTVSISVNGGRLYADSTAKMKLVLNVAGSVRFNKGSDGKDLQLILPTGVENTLHADFENIFTNNGIAYIFLKVSADTNVTTYQFCPYWMTQHTPQISVTLSDSLLLNVYVPVERTRSFTLNGVHYDANTLKGLEKIALADGKSYYLVTVNAGLITAGDEIELVSEVNTGGTTSGYATRMLSVVKYAKSLLATNPAEDQVKLVNDMLAYIKAACVYANAKAETVAAINAIIGENYTVDPEITVEAKKDVDGLDSAALLLGNAPAFVFYPETNEDGSLLYAAENYKFTIGNKATYTTEITEIDGKTAIVVRTYAYAMTYTVTYTVAGTDISGEYNLAAYLEFAEQSGDSNLVALVKALWQYSESALAYKTAYSA